MCPLCARSYPVHRRVTASGAAIVSVVLMFVGGAPSVGAQAGGAGVTRPRDMLKLGVLFQQQGNWGGRQVISRQWVAKSTAQYSTVGDQRYGYFWWHQWLNVSTPEGARRVDMVVATGNGGQKIYLVPSLDLVVVLTGGNYNATRSPATEIMAKELLPAPPSRAGKSK
jgi:CubicO group peptidase (beta-lactamase class C family)